MKSRISPTLRFRAEVAGGDYLNSTFVICGLGMPLLRRGITGFSTDRRVEFRTFKQAVHAAARFTGGTVSATSDSDGVTPNFYHADISNGDRQFSVVCNRNFPVIACVERPIEMSGIRPITVPGFLEVMCNFGFEIASVNELERPPDRRDLALLASAERKQVKYWKTRRVGDLIFNWWD